MKSGNRRVTVGLILSVVLAATAAGGCATHARPLGITPRVALSPTKDEITIQVRPGKPIGDIVPVDVSVANGTDEPYLIVPNQVFAVDEQGQKILAVPPSEAIQEAGDANALKAGLTGAAKNAAVGAIAGAVIGAAIGVAAGALVGEPGAGAAYGAMMGGGVGAAEGGVLGGVQGQLAAHQDAATQISALSLPAGEANPTFSVNGYVFFPKGNYTAVQMNLLDEETHQSETLTSPWADGQTVAAVAPRGNSASNVASQSVAPSRDVAAQYNATAKAIPEGGVVPRQTVTPAPAPAAGEDSEYVWKP